MSDQIPALEQAFNGGPPVDDSVLYDGFAETQVLGSILIRPAAYDEVIDSGVSGASFYRPAHETIFNAIADMQAEGKPTDPITVGEELRRRGQADVTGGVAYLHQMVQSVPSAANVEFYADIVRERWLLREYHYTGLRIIQMSTGNGEGEIGDLLQRGRSQIDELIDLNAGHLSSEDDVIDEVLTDLAGPKKFVQTPFGELTVAIGGWRPGNLYVIGARPSVGKTAVAGQIVIDAMYRGLFPIFFSLEMPKQQVIERLLSNIGEVDGSRILHHSLRGDDEERLAKAAAILRKHRYLIDDRSRLSIQQMRATIRSMQRVGLPVIPVIDYLQIIKTSGKSDDRRVEVDGVAQALKEMAKDCNVPVIALAQLNRGAEGRADPMPGMKDLRESGNIEQAADTVALLHRDTQDPQGQRVLHWLIAKARHGRVCSFSTLFEGEFSRVSDMRPY